MTTSLGIMSVNLSSEIAYFNEIAQRAKDLDIECFRFIPTSIDPVTQQTAGLKFDADNQSWTKSEFPIPSVLYDRCFYGDDDHSKQCLPIVSWLKSRKDITFLGYGLPDKLELYHSLSQSLLAPYLPLSSLATDAEFILHQFEKHSKLILKPISGSQGNGIYYLKKMARHFHVKTEKQKQIISRIFPNETKMTQWLSQLIKQHKYLLQPYLELSNKELQPFDIRVFLQKNEQGRWTERGKGLRIGNSGGILSNLSAGGKIAEFDSWISSIPFVQQEFICSEIDYIINHLPRLLEAEFLPLFELGIDIGVAKNGSVWILDVNSKPGRKVILSTKPDLTETLFLAPLLYSKHLETIEMKERKPYHAKTLSH